MYETEVNVRIESSKELSADVVSAFGKLRGGVQARSVLPWSEHCTECVWPTCYQTCDLYSPREDLRCRRFVDGMVRIDCPESVNSYLLKIRFKRWGKLWTPGSIRLHSSEAAGKLERRDQRIGSMLYNIALPAPLKRVVIGKRYSFKKRVAQGAAPAAEMPDCFLLECYNPQAESIALSFTIRSDDKSKKIPFQRLIELKPGYQQVRIDCDEISAVLDLQARFSIEMIPNEVPDGTTLYFGAMDFVREVKTSQKKQNSDKEKGPKKIKCVVWDLDNTLWDGILVEGGAKKLKLKPGVADVIQELDRRGILHSVASKNNPDEALEVLKGFGLADYFLCPQISWKPKGEAVKRIANALNIGLDTLLFIDDSDFEREQVLATCGEVRVVPAEDYLKLPGMKECDVPVTAEASNRRAMYQVEATRQSVADSFGEDYFSFLKQCQIKLNLAPLTTESLERVHELTQRTNQMNFSGNRYSRELLREIASQDHLDTFVLTCEDRFGSYGAVGFSIVDRREPRMTDLMFSCRVQSKRVEHAFLGFLIRKYSAECGGDFLANWRKTERNAPSAAVFADIGMQEMGVADGVTTLVFSKDKTPPDDGIVQIVVQDAVTAGA